MSEFSEKFIQATLINQGTYLTALEQKLAENIIKVQNLEKELAEVKKQSTATLMTSTDLGLNSATNMQTLLMTVTDLGLKLGDLEKQLKEMGVNE